MSIAIPFLVLLLVGAVAAYHRLRLAVWAALTATALVACWLLGANAAATAVAGVLSSTVVVYCRRQPRMPVGSTTSLSGSLRRSTPGRSGTCAGGS